MDQSKRNFFLVRGSRKRSRKPIRRVSAKRSSRLREYMAVRKTFLTSHPYCQWVIFEAGNKEEDVIKRGGIVITPDGMAHQCPMATEVHHRKGRIGANLTDPNFFMAVSSFGHQAIHHYVKRSYEQGYMLSR